MKTRPVLVLILSVIFGSCQYLPFWPKENKPSSNPDLVLLVPEDTFPYPYPYEPIVPKFKGNVLYFLKGRIAAEFLCGDHLWMKELPNGPAREILDLTTLIDSFPDNCVNFYDLWFADTESLVVFTTGVPYAIPPSDTTLYPFHKLMLYDFRTGGLDTLHWGCASYIDPRFSASGRYIFVATSGPSPRCRGTLWRYDRETGHVDSVLTFTGGPRYGGWSIYTGYILEGDSAWIVQGDPVDMNVLPDLDTWEGRFVVMQKYYGPSRWAPGGLVMWDQVGRVLYTLDVPWPSPGSFQEFAEYYPQWVEIPGEGRGILLNLFFDPDGEGGIYASHGIWFVKHWDRCINNKEEVP